MPRLSRQQPHPIDIAAGRVLRLARARAAITQEMLGDLVGMTFQQIQKYEHAKSSMTLVRAQAFATALGISPLDFYDGVKLGDAILLPEFELWAPLIQRASALGAATDLATTLEGLLDLVERRNALT